MKLQDSFLTLEELKDESAETISGGVSTPQLPTFPTNLPFNPFANQGSTAAEESPEQSITKASGEIREAKSLLRLVKSAF
jgi:hypothetical protein